MKTRQTKQKKAIFEVLRQKDAHLQADEVYKLVRKQIKNISLATVYRNLESMASKGLLYEVYVSGRPRWFEVKKHDCHGHLFCRKCGKLFDVVDCSLCFAKKRMEKQMDFYGEETMYLVTGLCGDCKKLKKK